MRPAPYGAFKRFCLWQKPCRRANSLRPRILICQGPQKSLLFWARAPAARAGVAGAGAVGVNGDCFHSFLLGRECFCTIFAGKGRGPPCRAGRDGCYFLLAQKVTKDALGAPSMSAFAQRALIGGLPPSPHFTGDALLGVRLKPPGGPKTRSVIPLAPAHWGLPGQKFRIIRAVRTPPGWV